MKPVVMRERTVGAFLVVAGVVLMAVAALVTSLQSTSAQLANEYIISLYGPNEVPPIASDATATVRLQMTDGVLHYELVASGAAFTQAHIHVGAAGTNGNPVAFLLPLQTTPLTTVNVSGTITEADLINDFANDWDAFATAFLVDQLYVNIHSTANPGGELRAQVDPRYCAVLSGANETTPNNSTASGSAVINASTGGLGYGLSAANGSEEFTQAHIHQGAAGVDGPVMAFLFNAGTGNTVTSISVTGQVLVGDLLGPALNNIAGFMHYIAIGEAYVNVHSTEFPNGEIRGQLVHCDNVNAASPPDPTPTNTPTPTTTATATATATATTPAATNTPVPTNTPTATATTPPPGPPATGTGSQGPTNTPLFVLMLIGLSAIAAGGLTLATAQRRR